MTDEQATSGHTASPTSRMQLRSTPGVCCFDFDGLLVDSAGLWLRAYTETCIASGGSPSRIDMSELHGASVPMAAVALTRQIGTPVDTASLRQSLAEAFRSDPPPAFPGVETLLRRLAGVARLLVVTNGPGALVGETLARLGLRHRFDAIISAEHVAKPKPAPDVYVKACHRAGVSPAQALAFEDSPTGVLSARAAGLRIIGVPSNAALLNADLVVPSLEDPQVLTFLGIK